MLERMYLRFAERRGWKTSLIDTLSFSVQGPYAYGILKSEHGVHRLVRLSPFNADAKRQTSFARVEIMPQLKETQLPEIDPKDLEIDTYRASGAGRQHVNKTSSAVRIRHIPTGVAVACQQERSQHKNRDMAMSLLRARLLAAKEEAAAAKEASARKAQIGTADRSEKIRTYNFPQDRITDHRIKKSWSNIPTVMEGAFDQIFEDLRAADKELRLSQATENV